MRILIVGLGSIGQRHLRNLRALLADSVEIIAVRTRREAPVLPDNAGRRQTGSLSEIYGIREYSSLADALGEKPIAAFICNPTSLHVPVAIACARAACHLFVEKPVSDTSAGVGELVDEVRRRSLAVVVGFQMRHHPAVKALREVVQSGLIGQIVSARLEIGEYLPDWHPWEDYRQGYAARRDLGGGALATQSHEFDCARWMFGMPRRVFAVGGHLTSLAVNVEDVAGVLMEFRVNGKPVPVHFQLDYVRKPAERSFTVVGEKGNMRADLLRQTFSLQEFGRAEPVVTAWPDFNRNEMFMDELKHFLACINGTALPSPSLSEGVDNILIVEAARKSLEIGEAVLI